MWQPTSPIAFPGYTLTPVQAWIHVFAHAWQKLEPDPEDLNMWGFRVFGAAVAEKHGDEHPAEVARRLFPDAGEFTKDIYPGYEIPPSPAVEIADTDVPF